MRFNSTTQFLIAGNPPQLDKRLPFKRESLAARTVVSLELVESHRPRAGITIRSKPEVNLKDAFITRFNAFDHSPRERFENRTGAGSDILVYKKQLQIGRIAHLSSAEFAESTNRESSPRGAVHMF